MGRWGEEEKKSKGIFGCLFAVGVFSLCIYTFSRNYPQLEARAAMEKRLGSMITRNWQESELEIAERIQKITVEEGGSIELSDISVEKVKNSTSHYTFTVKVFYPLEVDMIVTKFDVNYPIFFEQQIIF